MNHLKTSIRTKENRKRWNFAIKLILLILLEFIYEGETYLRPLLDNYSLLNHVIRALIFLLSANLIISLGRIITLRLYLQKTAETKVLPNFVVGIGRISGILNSLALLISLMLAFGIRPLEFLTSITIVAAAIALLTKDYITSIVNGLIIMFSEQLEIGDKITIGKNTGFIRDFTLMNTVLKSETGEIIIIPNSMMLTSDVINYSKNNTHQVVFDAEMPYSTDLQLINLEEKLGEVLKQFSDYVILEGAQLNVLERKSDNVLVRYQFPIKSGEKLIESQVRKTINQAFLNWSNEHRKA
ncbi:MAG TPA: mechanosensitive ion channel protein MscS [Algoriphagus sp.]|jgi:small-conductance mechanosensitive channel|uniref:mechanosensitive ion channel family protein n=1 Tax=unclassified Algoriphagus TaxID=2641541 RepID=UPI000C598FEB|nr:MULTISPECIES: mechanosensitive ion channel domain-containing protein [unclassified Algoriphagus]MAL13108.1 mechanosensitive ion channel protein MscS [Algoriphagus sp.]MAN87305.1 mechanosensitive ion channel protein MscS [Algoriphagus sp.]QYH41047.1 mechanosensitive ion channel [Algoriphagus sp. NBT04N3]HAD51859.1 mechanosensitive ion channel protein MscS [Algoriphagus sp.]HAH36304.1 mechanosensitive ion channel protein MscS [Algoriphagus sp.]|tara:strand:- start:8428 stop:9321 length:894 start_codon:yes stop_codon:yes gene_type:complete